MVDTNEERQAAFENHVPEAVVYLLFFTAGVCIWFVSFGCGLNGKRMTGSTLLFVLTISSVLTIVLDIDRPRRGIIHVNQSSMLRIQEYIKSGKLPPVPDDLAAIDAPMDVPLADAQPAAIQTP